MSQARPSTPLYRRQSEAQSEVRWLTDRKRRGRDPNSGTHVHHAGMFSCSPAGTRVSSLPACPSHGTLRPLRHHPEALRKVSLSAGDSPCLPTAEYHPSSGPGQRTPESSESPSLILRLPKDRGWGDRTGGPPLPWRLQGASTGCSEGPTCTSRRSGAAPP